MIAHLCLWARPETRRSCYTNLRNPSLLAFITGLAPGIVQR